MRLILIAAAGLLIFSAPSSANDWDKFFTRIPGSETAILSEESPEAIPSTGDPNRDLEMMYRRGFQPIGYTSFNTDNSKTKDAIRLAKKIKARYYIVSVQNTSSQTSVLPLTLPATNTSTTYGTARIAGTGGTATGNYSSTTTTYGSNTTYIPYTVNRFNKSAVFFAEAPHKGTGIWGRDLTQEEAQHFETRRAFVVMYIRDGSPAFNADILPGDVVLKINDKPADAATWKAELEAEHEGAIEIIRNGSVRMIDLRIPEDWR